VIALFVAGAGLTLAAQQAATPASDYVREEGLGEAEVEDVLDRLLPQVVGEVTRGAEENECVGGHRVGCG